MPKFIKDLSKKFLVDLFDRKEKHKEMKKNGKNLSAGNLSAKKKNPKLKA